eukprot:12895205-Prorocentrum_lima.AAC.1
MQQWKPSTSNTLGSSMSRIQRQGTFTPTKITTYLSFQRSTLSTWMTCTRKTTATWRCTKDTEACW